MVSQLSESQWKEVPNVEQKSQPVFAHNMCGCETTADEIWDYDGLGVKPILGYSYLVIYRSQEKQNLNQ